MRKNKIVNLPLFATGTSYIRYGANIGLLFSAVGCFAYLKLPEFSLGASQLQNLLDGVASETVRTQLIVPLFLYEILPVGIKGLFVAGMISASLSTLDTSFLTWAGVFTQDVIIPLKKKRLTQSQQLKLLRVSVVGVGLFVYLFSITWKETQYIHMYFAITGAIYTGGAGSIILGALYWRRATVQGAWAAMITGSGLAIGGILASQLWGEQAWWPQGLNGMSMSVIASIMAIFVFIIFSLSTYSGQFNLEQLLNRKTKIEKTVHETKYNRKSNISRKSFFEIILGLIVCLLVLGMASAMVYTRTHPVTSESWLTFWKWYSFVLFGYSIPVTIWFFIGSLLDLKKLFARLESEVLDETDDGQIHQNETAGD